MSSRTLEVTANFELGVHEVAVVGSRSPSKQHAVAVLIKVEKKNAY